MWIYNVDSFLSIVKDRDSMKDNLLVRARFEGDINRLFPRVAVIKGAGTDYEYRASIPRREVVKTIMQEVSNIKYDNFKNANNRDRWDHLLDVWEVMADAQDIRENRIRGIDYK